MEIQDPEIISEFVIESTEHLADIETQLLTIEAACADVDIELVNTVFRGVHSIKGAAGFLGLTRINELAHNLENVLNMMRERELVPTSAIVDVMLRSSDQLRSQIENVEASNEMDVSENVAALGRIADGTFEDESDPAGEPETQDDPKTKADDSLAAAEALIAAMDAEGATCIQSMSTDTEPAKKTRKTTRKPAAKSAAKTKRKPAAKAAAKTPAKTRSRAATQTKRKTATGNAKPAATKSAGTKTVAAKSVVEPEMLKESAPKPSVKPESATPTASKANPESNIRVSVESLDRLMNLAGELVLARNQLMQSISSKQRSGLDAVTGKINQVTCDMQDAIMQTRMQPIGNVFTRFSRVVRDLSAKLGKQCSLSIEGKEVEVDKTICEAIADPLTHLVRNAVDHGLEMPAQRKANGKSAEGQVRLHAFHQSGKVCIEISDDGGGIDVDVIKRKAVEKSVITADQADAMQDRDAYRLIFMPGFSTAETISDVSGRGVGMDVVRTNIEKLGGTVEIDSRLGHGTKIQVTLPLTLAIIPSLIVRCGEDRFAIPQVNIAELVRIRSVETQTRIGRVKDAEALRLRGSLLPLIRLDAALDSATKPGTPQTPKDKKAADESAPVTSATDKTATDESVTDESVTDESATASNQALNIIVVETGQLRYGLVVDGLSDSEEIVVKPLGRHLNDCRCFSGATILGDGRVSLILDITGIGQHVSLDTNADVAARDGEATIESGNAGDTQSLLLFHNEPSQQFAVPMGVVSRIERVDASQIQTLGKQLLLQYETSSLPLIAIEDHIQALPRSDQDRISIIVCMTHGKEIGLIAPVLHDVREVTAVVDDSTLREPGVMGSMVIDETTTRLLDIHEIVSSAHPDWFEEDATTPSTEATVARILLAEDSKFFRNQVKKQLVQVGHKITEAEDGLEAWETLQKDPDAFDLIVTDIQMPRMDGFEFCEQVRRNPLTKHLPVIALTSLSGDEDVRRGQECGVDDYQVKMDREKLMAAVERLRLRPKS